MEKIVNIPNALSLLRLLFIPFIIYFGVKEIYYVAFLIYLAAALTDILDGVIARKKKQVTNFGSTFDPIVDTTLFTAVYVLFFIKELLPLWIILLAALAFVFHATAQVMRMKVLKTYLMKSTKYVRYAVATVYLANAVVIANISYKEVVFLFAASLYLIVSLHLFVNMLRKNYDKVFR